MNITKIASTRVVDPKHAALLAVGAAALSLISFSASAALPPPQQEVQFADLDLTSKQDAERLYRRLRTASSEVCSDFRKRHSARMQERYRECVSQAVENAVATIAHPSLTALHAAKNEVKLAQGVMKSAPRS